MKDFCIDFPISLNKFVHKYKYAKRHHIYTTPDLYQWGQTPVGDNLYRVSEKLSLRNRLTTVINNINNKTDLLDIDTNTNQFLYGPEYQKIEIKKYKNIFKKLFRPEEYETKTFNLMSYIYSVQRQFTKHFADVHPREGKIVHENMTKRINEAKDFDRNFIDFVKGKNK